MAEFRPSNPIPVEGTTCRPILRPILRLDCRPILRLDQLRGRVQRRRRLRADVWEGLESALRLRLSRDDAQRLIVAERRVLKAFFG